MSDRRFDLHNRPVDKNKHCKSSDSPDLPHEAESNVPTTKNYLTVYAHESTHSLYSVTKKQVESFIN
jgi:hypothetical protein